MSIGSKEAVIKGVAWQSTANWGCQLLSFGIYTGLARLLSPQAFGMVAIGGVYIAFVQIFVDQGFGTAIIQRRDLDPEHIDSAFWIGIGTATLFCGLSLLLAGPIAHVFKEPKVAPVIAWLSLLFPLIALSSAPTAILTRELNFRPVAIRSLIATGMGGAVGLGMAFCGRGVWSLVGQQLVGAIAGCVCLWAAVPWRPRFRISGQHLRDLYGFSLTVTGTDILWFFAQKSDQTLVGYGFGPSSLGPYSLAGRLSNLLVGGLTGPLQGVAFPAFAKLQSEPRRLESALHRYCEISCFVCLPALVGMAAVAPELVRCLFGPRWTAAVPILQALALYGAVRVVLSFVHPLMLAMGCAGFYLSMNIVLSLLTFCTCLLSVRWSPEAIAYSMVVSLSLFAVLFFVMARRFLRIEASPLLRSFVFPTWSSVVMATAVVFLRNAITRSFSPMITLAICVSTGVFIYVSVALYVRPDLLKEICKMLTELLRPVMRSNYVAPTAPAQVIAETGGDV